MGQICERAGGWSLIEDISESMQAVSGLSDDEHRRWLTRIPLLRSEFEIELRRTVRECVLPYATSSPYGWEDRVRPYFPSTSAHYINSRKAGGAVGFVLEHPDLLDGLREEDGYLRPEVRVVNGESVVFYAGEEDLRLAFDSYWQRLLRVAAAERPDVEPVGLAEALKVRVITKGPPAMQTVMRPLQRYLFACLSRLRVFKSLSCGGDLDPVFLTQVFGSLRAGQKFLSGDFEAATDNLKPWVSETLWSELSAVLGLAPMECQIGKTLLTGHFFSGKPQINGQLMGSILSFPILCLANLTLCRVAIEADLSIDIHGRF